MRFAFLILNFLISLVAGTLAAFGYLYFFVELPVIEKRFVEERTYLETSKLTEVAAEVLDSVVSIEVTSAGSGGSGFFVSEDGLLMTNRHVVDFENARYRVSLNGGERYFAELISVDPFSDIAVLQILAEPGRKLPKFKPVKFAADDNLEVGQQVLAVGNVLSEFQNTVTAGIVSAKNRYVAASDKKDGYVAFSGLIQTDAALNLGNSGGPLLNLSGELVGMNVALDSRSQGVAFAIPVSDLRVSIESVKRFGKIVRPVLGVSFLMLTAPQALNLTGAYNHGAILVSDFTGATAAIAADSPANVAGLRFGDLILKVDGVEINMDQPLDRLIAGYSPGEEVVLEVWRDAEVFAVKLELASSEDFR